MKAQQGLSWALVACTGVSAGVAVSGWAPLGWLSVSLAVIAMACARAARAAWRESARVIEARARALEADRLRLQAILEHLPVGVVMVDSDGEAPWPINAAGRSLLGGSADARRRGASSFERPDGTPLAIDDDPLRTALASREPVYAQALRLRREDESVVELEVSAAPVFTREGTLLGAVAVFDDRTAANRGRRQLERLLEQRSEFLATVSHALRTPLTVVTGFADLLWEGSYGPIDPALRHPLGRLRANAAHLLELVNGLLDLARLRAGRLAIEPEVFELAPVLWDAAAAVRRAACERIEVEVVCGADHEPLRVHADRNRLAQALRQLCAGAIELEPRGVLTIRAHAVSVAERAYAEIELRDAGGALDGDLLALVLADGENVTELDPDESGTTEQLRIDQSGLRVGVRTAAGLIRLMGGRLGMERLPAGGVRLFVHLPLVQGPVVAAAERRELELSHVG